MAAYTWPSSLPLSPAMAGYTESLRINVIGTPGDNGPAKFRRRGASTTPISYEQVLNGGQVEVLRDFVVNTLMGVRRFNLTHPRTGAQVEARIVPAGEFYKLSAMGGDLWHVAMNLEILP